MRISSLVAVFAITISVTILALALAMSTVYFVRPSALFWNNIAFTIAMILLITFPTALVVSKMSFDVLVLNKKLRKITRYDQLTGTLRREAFFKDLREKKTLNTGVALMMDVDDLPHIVDDFGHEATDDVLKAVALVMTDALRDDDKVCRLGYDKFVVVLQSVTLEEGLNVARRVQATISQSPIASGKYMIPVSVSIGAVSIEQNGDIDSVVEMVSHQLSQSKPQGHNRLSFPSGASAGGAGDPQLVHAPQHS